MREDRQHGGWLPLRLPRQLNEKQLAAAGLGLQAATAVLAISVSWKFVRGLGRVIFGHHDSSSAATPGPRQSQHAADEEVLQGPPPTAQQQWPAISSTPPPELPADAALVAEGLVQCSTYQFYLQFLSCESTFLADHNRTCGQQNVKVTRWVVEEGGLSRTFTFQEPKKPIMPSAANCCQRQRLARHLGDVLTLTTDTTVSGVPYCDAFRVEGYWRVTPSPESPQGACRVTMHVAVPFSKFCIMQRVIRGTSIGDSKKAWGALVTKMQAAAAGDRQGLLPAPSSGLGRRGSLSTPVEAEVVLPSGASITSSAHKQQQQAAAAGGMLKPWGSAWTASLAAVLTPPGVHPATLAAASRQQQRQQQQQQLHHLSLQSSLLVVVLLLQLYIIFRARATAPCALQQPGGQLHEQQQQAVEQWCGASLAAQLSALQL